MEFFLTLVLWAAILLIALYVAQLVLGFILYAFMLVIMVIMLPFKWAYGRIKEGRND